MHARTPKPGCSQGNNIWMLRELARMREAQGNATGAAELRALASDMARQTIQVNHFVSQSVFDSSLSPAWLSMSCSSRTTCIASVGSFRHNGCLDTTLDHLVGCSLRQVMPCSPQRRWIACVR